jgi:hypothetical protein
MPKQLETVDRIQIIAEAPSLEVVGAGLAALTKLGFENVGYKLVTDVLAYKNKRAHEVSVTDFAAAFVQAHPRFKPPELAAHFRAAGRSAGGAYYAIDKLTKTNVIRKNGDEFVRVEALPAPEKKAKAPRGVPNKELIAKAIKGRKQITLKELREVFVAEGRNEKSISPILSVMTKNKRLKQTGPGLYAVNGAHHG